jgi:pimeloyl-ACP methyl ester carboxylesterase
LNTPDAQEGAKALDPDGVYSDWRQEIAARSALATGAYRPGPRYAAQVRPPLLVLVCDDDLSVLPGPGVRAAERAPHGELVRIPGGHYAPFLDGHEVAVECQVDFLRRHVLRGSDAERRSESESRSAVAAVRPAAPPSPRAS